MAYYIDQQPRDRVWVERVDVGGGFSGDLASVGQLPGRSGGVMADYFVFAVVQIGVGSF
jgi:hypothetical protein